MIDLYNMENQIENTDYLEIVKKRVKENEGRKNIVYTDTEGYLTVGIGYKLPKDSDLKEGDYVDDAFIDDKFNLTFNNAVEGAKRLTKGFNLKEEAFGVVTEMVFQMGETGVSGFTETLKYLKNNEYKKASEEMLRGKKDGTVSKWAQQTPNRAIPLSNIIASLEE